MPRNQGAGARRRKQNEGRTSPIKAPARRVAGQGVREKLDDIVAYEALPWFVAGCVALTFVALAWAEHAIAAARAPWTTTLAGLVLAAAGVVYVLRAKRRAPNYRLGLDGELAVADILDDLRERGYKVLHDIPGERGNVDHVVIGPAGVFAIETKARSKVEGKYNSIRVKGDRVCFTPSGNSCDKAIPQAKAAAARIGSTLRERSGMQVYAQAVLVYPGWWVDTPRRDDVWVMNPGQLVGRLRDLERSNSGAGLTRREVEGLVARLEQPS